MRTAVLVCWAVVGALVVTAEAKPFNHHHQSPHDIAAAYDAYHQIWMAEARRNSVAPGAQAPRLRRLRPRMRKVPTQKKAAPEAVPEEKPVQGKAPVEAVPETKAAPAQEKTVESQPMVEEPAPEPTTEQPAVTEPVTEVTTLAPVEEQTAAEARVSSQQVAPEQELTKATPVSNVRSAYDDFFTLWNAERIRNSRPPVAKTIPEMRRELMQQQQMRLRAEQAALAAAAEKPAEAPPTKAPVDAPQKPAEAATASDVAALVNGADWLSLAQKQGASPLIIVLQNSGAEGPQVITG